MGTCRGVGPLVPRLPRSTPGAKLDKASGVRIVAKFDTSITDWLDAMNSSLDISADCKVPGSDWREVVSKGVGLAYEDFW